MVNCTVLLPDGNAVSCKSLGDGFELQPESKFCHIQTCVGTVHNLKITESFYIPLNNIIMMCRILYGSKPMVKIDRCW